MTEPHITTGDQLLHDSEARLAVIEQTSREVAAMTAVARTPDGHATVTVGAGGSVRSIDIGADALRGSPAQLGSALVAAIAQASADVARQSAALLAERTGIDITERVAAAQVLAGDGHRARPHRRPPHLSATVVGRGRSGRRGLVARRPALSTIARGTAAPGRASQQHGRRCMAVSKLPRDTDKAEGREPSWHRD